MVLILRRSPVSVVRTLWYFTIYSTLAREFKVSSVRKSVFRTLEPTVVPTNLTNQIKVGHALDQPHNFKSRGPERTQWAVLAKAGDDRWLYKPFLVHGINLRTSDPANVSIWWRHHVYFHRSAVLKTLLTDYNKRISPRFNSPTGKRISR